MADALLVNPREASALAAAGECVIFDCRFDLQHPDQGRNSWLAAHIPGAVYAHLDDHLSGDVTAKSGRHPLPDTRSFASFLARAGWVQGQRIIAYDAQSGAIAARLWWLMRYYGHDCVSLLDGGLSAWQADGLPLETGPVYPLREPLPVLRAHTDMLLDSEQVAEGLAAGQIALVDARDSMRFEGQTEPLDTVAGHIPGAVNHPYTRNLVDGRFRPVAELREAFSRTLGGRDPGRVAHMCGSGVTACHNLLAMESAGLEGSRLYPGSWSEWIRDPTRPVATGPA